MKVNSKTLFGVRFDELPMTEVLDSAMGSGFEYVVTPNVQHVVELSKNNQLRAIFGAAKLSLCDSRVIQLLSVKLNSRVKNVIPGSDLTEFLFLQGALRKKRVMIVGSDSSSVQSLTKKYSLEFCEHYEPPMGFINSGEEVSRLIDEVNTFQPQVLFLALGFPRQEMVAHMLHKSAKFPCVAFCIGASIDFLTGKQVRAPEVWRHFRLEWLHRFLSNPSRLFKRYFVDGLGIFPLFYKEWLKRKVSAKSTTP